MPELDELDELEEELEDELLDDDELLDEELLDDDELDELELLPVGIPEEPLPPPQPTRRTQPASRPPVTLSNFGILYMLFFNLICCLLIYYKCHLVSRRMTFSRERCARRSVNGFVA